MKIYTLSTQQSGIGLIEILVSVAILSIGLVGLAGLHVASIRYNQDSYLRNVATTQVQGMADRMRANRAAVRAGSYNSITNTPSNPSCTTQCTTAEIAQRDAYEWNTDNGNLLPSGQGRVAGSNGVFTVTIMWDSLRTGATGTNCSNNTSVDLTCYSVSLRL